MGTTPLISAIREELQSLGREDNRQSGKRFFKETINTYGVQKPAVDKIAKKKFQEIESPAKVQIFELCEQLWESGTMGESLIACKWSYFVRHHFLPDDFYIFEKWIEQYISNWATCDTFCNHTMGAFLMMYPEKTAEIKRWAQSENRWQRRASAVSLIVPARKGYFISEVFETASLLLHDKDDLVQKGYGWMLKVASKHHPEEVFDFVYRRKDIMPRTALRYAIEKLPAEQKKTAMAK